jgi:hypothetical protein
MIEEQGMSLPAQVRLFVSGGPDQDPARELVGRALTDLPVNVGWGIKRTPDVDSVAECHLFLLLLGADISAPVGWELLWARRTEKPVLAFRAETLRTPAGQVFLQDNAGLDWMRYADLPGLRRLVLGTLSRFLLAHGDRYGLALWEIERLHGLLADLDRHTRGETPVGATGAGGGGVILAPGKDQPVGARLIGDE